MSGQLPAGEGAQPLALGEAWRAVAKGEPSPFFDLWAPPVPERSTLDQALIATWIAPLCAGLDRGRFIEVLADRWGEIDAALISRLLHERLWRARIAGSYLVGLKRDARFVAHVAGHLLRSETPYAGQVYCLALARVEGPLAEAALRRYLDHYLAERELLYDQCAAMGALAWLGNRRGEDLLADYLPAWEAFTRDKPLDLAGVCAQFASQVGLLAGVQETIEQA